MTRRLPLIPVLSCAALLVIACPAALAQEPPLQCVPYARQISGIQIYGDAHSWWQQADGRYAKGNRPVLGAVMAFKPYRAMQLGHVAAVSRIVDSRRVLLNHANWSPINGRRGQIERDVLAEDVSAGNDWSEVRVWYTPTGELGTTRYPVHGFIYPQGRAPQITPHNTPRIMAQREQIARNDAAAQPLSRDERKAQRLAEKEARKQLKLIEKQRKDYAKYLRELQKSRRESVRVAPPAAPHLPSDPIGDLLEQVGS